MNFIRKILGLGPKDPVNIQPRKQTSQMKREEVSTDFINEGNIFPTLVTERTQVVDLEDQITSVFHRRENSFNRSLLALVSFDYQNLDKEGEDEVFQVKPLEQEAFLTFLAHAEKNIEKLDISFLDWNPVDMKLPYRILSAPITFFTSELILSQKHMLEAHRILNAKELMVSIPRRDIIFISDRELNKENYKHFLNMHAAMVLQENEEHEILCEDIFILENGEITGVVEIHQLSEVLQDQK